MALLLRHWTREVSGRHFRSSPSCSHLRSVPPRRPSACRFCLSLPRSGPHSHTFLVQSCRSFGGPRRLFAQCVSWVRSKSLPVSFSLFLLSTYVLPSASFGIEFAGECPRSLAKFDRALRQWGHHLLGWPSGTPNASVLCELGLHDGLRVSSGRALALYARLASYALGSRPPVPASVFTLAQSTPGSWAH